MTATPSVTDGQRIHLPRLDNQSKVIEENDGTIAVVFLDVGQGDAALIMAPEGDILIIRLPRFWPG